MRWGEYIKVCETLIELAGAIAGEKPTPSPQCFVIKI